MIRTLKNYLLIVIFSASSYAVCHSQTLHAVVFCNTIDESIGKSMEVELQNVTREIKKINELLGYDEDFYQLDGKICTRANLKKAIDMMDVEENDIIITFYGGHGSHAPNNGDDPWPQYLMNSGFENQGNWVPMASVIKWVQAKKPRLGIILSNCCNVVQQSTTVKPLWAMGGDYTRLSGINADNYKKLFSTKGIIAATSSKIPEPSWCNARDGGLFTNDLVDVLNMVGTGDIQPDWNSVLKKTYDKCASRDIVDRDNVHHRQHPYYEVKTGAGSIIPPPNHDRKSNDGLQQALFNIVNKNINESTRLGMIDNIINQHFGSLNKVMTVGTDLKTVVDYENPKDFLRRICLSPYIVQVNIITKEDGVLTVHEIRTQ